MITPTEQATSPTQVPSLPVELICNILECVKNDRQTVLRCLSVNSVFYMQTRPLLYGELRLYKPTTTLRCLALIARDRHVGSYVKDLDFWMSRDYTLQAWQLVVRALQNMVNLVSIRINGSISRHIWALSSLNSPRLVTVSMNCEWSPSLEKWLTDRPSIRTVGLWLNGECPYTLAPNVLPYLTRINCWPGHTLPGPFAMGRPVKELMLSAHFTFNEEDVEMDANFGARCCLSSTGPLKHLYIGGDHAAIILQAFSIVPTVETLSIWGEHLFADSNTWQPLLHAIRPFPALWHVKLYYTFDPHLADSFKDQILPSLSQTMFRSLKCISLLGGTGGWTLHFDHGTWV